MAEPQFQHPPFRALVRRHVWYECSKEHDGHCMWCDGGLGSCTVCGAFEGQLLTSCPGVPLTEEALEACYSGNVVDFVCLHEYRSYCRKNGLLWPPDWAVRAMRR